MITVDRLILSVDAMTPDRAERLVRMAGQQLVAQANPGGAVSVAVDRIDVALPTAGASDAAIAAALCAAIRARIG
jgi:uncharacterized protein HemX